MAFYGERFRRPDEEDIWEELKKMVSNQSSQKNKSLITQQNQLKPMNEQNNFPNLGKEYRTKESFVPIYNNPTHN